MLTSLTIFTISIIFIRSNENQAMAKTKKVNVLIKNNLGIKKNPKTRNGVKKISFDCIVKLENIDHLLQKYGLSDGRQQSEQFDIAIKIRENNLMVCGQQLFIQNNEKQFRLNLRIKNHALTVRLPDEPLNDIATKSKNDEMTVRMIRPQRKAIAMTPVEEGKNLIDPPGKLNRKKTLAELANDAWKLCKKRSKSEETSLDVGQFVIAKMKSYSPWAAKIINFTKNRKKANVFFFGTHNSGSVDINEITLFQSSNEVIRLLLLRNLEFFAKGVREAEIELGIPHELSITNQHVLKE